MVDHLLGHAGHEDWVTRDPDAFLEDTCREVPFPEGAADYFVVVTVTRDAEHPLGRLLGDLLVRLQSASGRGRRHRIPFEIGRGRHLGGRHHFDLLHRREVYEQRRGCWGAEDEPPRPALHRRPSHLHPAGS